MQRLTVPQAQAYISAVFKLSRHGNTFAKEANEMIKELVAPEVVAAELFYHVEHDPVSPFESCLRQEAQAIMQQVR